jgi:hypothetical protein
VPNLVRDRAEGGHRRWGGSGSFRRRWRRGVLQARMSEGGRGVVEELLYIGVVLLVPLAGMERLCTDGSMGIRAAAELEAHWLCEGCRSGARK